jgi:hypothetical protein
MMEMRRWLDHHQSRAEKFEYYQLAYDIIVTQLEFVNEGDACAFDPDFSGGTILIGKAA